MNLFINAPFGEEKQLDASEPVQVTVSEDDANGGF